MCECVCVYIHTYIRRYICTYLHTCACTHSHTHILERIERGKRRKNKKMDDESPHKKEHDNVVTIKDLILEKIQELTQIKGR